MSSDIIPVGGNMQDSPVYINLDALDSADVRPEKEIIFQSEFHHVLEIIRKKSRENRCLLKEKDDCGHKKNVQFDESRGVPACFFIDGSRGSGKSTMLRAVRDALVNGKFFKENEERICLHSLADVDPTELGKGENFFLYLLERIYKLLEDAFDERNKEDEAIDYIRLAMEDLRKMSGGLQVLLDSNAALKEHDNPDFFLEECIDKCADSMRLRNKLCELLGKVSKIVRKDVFLVTIDDADLNFSKCEDVLEYVRKYMQTPRLIFLFAGDIRLYSHIVRRMQIKGFGNELFQFDSVHRADREQMIQHMEEQYLLKLFPMANRVGLPHVMDVIGEGKMVLLTMREWGKIRDMGAFVDAMLSPVFGTYVRKARVHILKALPLRSVLSLLVVWSSLIKHKKYASCGCVHAVVQGFFSELKSCLKEYMDDDNVTAEPEFSALLSMLRRYFTKADLWQTELDFVPENATPHEWMLSAYMCASVLRATCSYGAQLFYFCAIYPQKYRYTENVIPLEVSMPVKQVRTLSSYGATACACVAPWVRRGAVKNHYANGTVRLMQSQQRSNSVLGLKARIPFSAFAKELSMALRKSENVMLPLALTRSICYIDEGDERHYYLSIYNLILTAAEWLQIASDIRSGNKKENDALKTEVRKVLSRHIRSAHICAGTSRKNVTYHQNEVVDGKTEVKHHYFVAETNNISDAVIDEISAWAVRFSGETNICPPYRYARCWNNFIWKCEDFTRDMTIEVSSDSTIPCAGTLFVRYLEAFETALKEAFSDWDGGDEAILLSISSFPLWRALKNADCDNEPLFASLNSVNIGAMVDCMYQQRVAAAEKEVNENRKRVEEAENKQNKAQLHLTKANAEKESAQKKTEPLRVKVNALTKTLETVSRREERAKGNVSSYMDDENRLWSEILDDEMLVAGGHEMISDAHEVEFASLMGELEKKRKSLSRLRNAQRRETVLSEIADLEKKLQTYTGRDFSEDLKKKKEYNALTAGVAIKRNRLHEIQKKTLAAQKEFQLAQKDTLKVIKELNMAEAALKEAEAQKEENIRACKDAELKLRESETSLLHEKEKLAAAENRLEVIKQSTQEE